MTRENSGLVVPIEKQGHLASDQGKRIRGVIGGGCPGNVILEIGRYPPLFARLEPMTPTAPIPPETSMAIHMNYEFPIKEILVHGRRCDRWVEPTSIEGWERLALVRRDEEGGYSALICPACREQVILMSNHGELDLGVATGD